MTVRTTSVLLATWVAVAGAGAIACAGSGSNTERPRQDGTVMADTGIMAAQKELTDSIITKPGVMGTAIGLCDDVPCIKVYLARRDEELLKLIPDTFKGFKVDIEVTGEFTPQDTTG